MMDKGCLNCDKLVVSPYPWKKYCCTQCKGKSYYRLHRDARRNYYAKNFETISERTRKCFKKWYALNKKEHNKKVYSYYQKNKDKWNERKYANSHRKVLLHILGMKCMRCGSIENLEFHHITYIDLPRRNVNEYAKNLLLLCNRCHNKMERKYAINTNI